MTVTLHHGDCLDVLATLPDNSIDAIVTDPPYGLSDHKPADVVECLTAWLAGEPYVNGGKGFMGKTWDAWVPGPEVWRECYRVLKPGGYLLTFAGSRSYDLMGIALRLAGFRAHPLLGWIYGQGFPKATNLGKMLDKAAGVEREVVGEKLGPNGQTYSSMRHMKPGTMHEGYDRPWKHDKEKIDASNILTAPATPEARQWDGWFYGLQSLKPALEPILMAQKPPDRAMTANVLHWGTGAVNVDGCRVGTDERTYAMSGAPGGNGQRLHGGDGRDAENARRYAEESKAKPPVTVSGRFPPNLLHDGSDAVRAEFPNANGATSNSHTKGVNGSGNWGMGTTEKALGYNDTGSASRFYPALGYDDEDVETARFLYCGKATKRDRDEGCEGLEARGGKAGELTARGNTDPVCQQCGGSMIDRGNGRCECDIPDWRAINNKARNHHPTVKPTALMRWLVRLVTPPGGVVLDPFMGSGSTLKAAVMEGFDGIGIEQDAEYLEIARRRIAAAELPLLAATKAGNE